MGNGETNLKKEAEGIKYVFELRQKSEHDKLLKDSLDFVEKLGRVPVRVFERIESDTKCTLANEIKGE